MKTTILIFMILTLINCKTQKPINNDKMKKFDIETFNKNKNQLNEYNYTTDDNTHIEQAELEIVFIENINKKNTFFVRKNQYYKNGNIKISGLYFHSSFKKGIWKKYDENGNLTKETNYDEGFNYTWEDLLKLLEKRKVNIKDTDNTTITKEDGNWRFDYIEGIYIYDVIVDGKTGEILQNAKNIFQEGS